MFLIPLLVYKFSIAIQNPVPRDRLERCSSIDVSFYEHTDVDSACYKFPKADKYLTTRLGRANTKRRQLLKYYQEHRENIVATSGEEIETIDPKALDHTSTTPPGPDSLTTQTPVSTAQDYGGLDVTYARSEAALSRTTYSYAYYSTERPHVPPPPNQESAFIGEPFLCPYCFFIIFVKGRQSWVYVTDCETS